MISTNEILASFRLQVSALTLIENEAQKQNLLTPMTAPYSSSRRLPRQRFRGHKMLFHGGWMRSQNPFTYAGEKPLYSVTALFQKWKFPLHLRKYSHPSVSLHVLCTLAKIIEK